VHGVIVQIGAAPGAGRRHRVGHPQVVDGRRPGLARRHYIPESRFPNNIHGVRPLVSNVVVDV
jgi:hypothetical protein